MISRVATYVRGTICSLLLLKVVPSCLILWCCVPCQVDFYLRWFCIRNFSRSTYCSILLMLLRLIQQLCACQSLSDFLQKRMKQQVSLQKSRLEHEKLQERRRLEESGKIPRWSDILKEKGELWWLRVSGPHGSLYMAWQICQFVPTKSPQSPELTSRITHPIPMPGRGGHASKWQQCCLCCWLSASFIFSRLGSLGARPICLPTGHQNRHAEFVFVLPGLRISPPSALTAGVMIAVVLFLAWIVPSAQSQRELRKITWTTWIK